MKLRHGLQARFLQMMVVVFALILGLLALLLHRQERMQQQVEGITREAMARMAGDSLKRRGEVTAGNLAEALANPLYYFDLDEVGQLAAAVRHRSDTRYVLVYDAEGNVLHDGSPEIGGFGTRMGDPMAQAAIHARTVQIQFSPSTMDVSAPIRIGGEYLGGVRIGYDLVALNQFQERAITGLRARLSEFGRSQRFWVALLGLGLLAFGAGVLWFIQRQLVQPIRQLVDSAREIEAGHFDTRLPVTRRGDELGDLLRAFSRMSESVARHDRDIRHMAYTDALTGLANRLAFREMLAERLQQLQGRNRQLALLFADIDDFKRVNDTLGHDAGDEVLVKFVCRIRDAVEEVCGDRATMARFGGDEFVILVEAEGDGVDVRMGATRLAETLLERIAAPLRLRDRDVFLGMSVGITLFPGDAMGASSLMKNGDIAMYQAKVAGKNCHRFYSRAMDQAVERRVNLEQELRGAWDRGELSLVYQPVYGLAGGALLGAEALLRWRHPEHGSVAPSVFIDVAEQNGLIEVIGPQVLRTACADAVRWQALRQSQGAAPLFVSVNVSPRQLRGGELPGVVADCLEETGLDPQRLHLELTETAVIGDEVHVSNLLNRLRSTGVKVWLDDFGTGFSGLSHLRRVPVDGVKIDRSFVADILRDPDDLALTTAIIAMAHSLGIIVVAEGVEKEGQYALLRERGCDLAQGYWLGHPVPMDAFTALLEPSRPLVTPL